MAELGANDEQMDFEVVYASGMQGIAGYTPDALTENLEPVFEKILRLPKAPVDPSKPLQMLVANIDYDGFKGKLGVGRILNGKISVGDTIKYGKPEIPYKSGKIVELFTFNNVGRQNVETASAGDIVMISGIEDISIGDTVMDPDNCIPLPPISVEEPTVRMSISVNKSPLGGREGKLLQSRVIRDRLYKELDKNVALQVSETDNADTYEVSYEKAKLHLKLSASTYIMNVYAYLLV